MSQDLVLVVACPVTSTHTTNTMGGSDFSLRNGRSTWAMALLVYISMWMCLCPLPRPKGSFVLQRTQRNLWHGRSGSLDLHVGSPCFRLAVRLKRGDLTGCTHGHYSSSKQPGHYMSLLVCGKLTILCEFCCRIWDGNCTGFYISDSGCKNLQDQQKRLQKAVPISKWKKERISERRKGTIWTLGWNTFCITVCNSGVLVIPKSIFSSFSNFLFQTFSAAHILGPVLNIPELRGWGDDVLVL